MSPSNGPSFAFLVLRMQGYTAVPSFYVGTEDLNSGLHASAASTLHTKPSPSLSEADFYVDKMLQFFE